VNYQKGICPVAENFNDAEFLGLAMCLNELSADDVDLLVQAFKKVWENLESLS
jgi:hypothetical protein